MNPILVIGLHPGDQNELPAYLMQQILSADLLAGAPSVLARFVDYTGETIQLTAALVDAALERLQWAYQHDQQVVVLASGDPLVFDIGAALRSVFTPEQMQIIPAPSLFQMAFAALAEPWADATLLDAVRQPMPDLVRRIIWTDKAAILTDDAHDAQAIAVALLKAGLSPDTRCAVCEHPGRTSQKIHHLTLTQAVRHPDFALPNVFVVWRSQIDVPPPPYAPGLPDDTFATTDGLITQREIRLLSLSEIALNPEQVFWDIGAGSGSVAIEAARSQPLASIYAIEKRARFCEHIRDNMRRFEVQNMLLTEGVAPEGCRYWPDPHAVFIGGKGGNLRSIVDMVKTRLHVGGRMVLNAITLESLAAIRRVLPRASVIQVQINRGVPDDDGDLLRLEALNPVFILVWQKPADPEIKERDD